MPDRTSRVPDECSDDRLVAGAIAGEEGAFAVLVERYTGRVYALAYRNLGDAHMAEDAVQESLLRAYSHLDHYRPGSSFRAWLLTIATNWCRDYHRQAYRLTRLGFLDASLVDDECAIAPELRVLAAERRAHIRAWLETVSADERTLLLLRHDDGLTYAQIAARLGKPESTVRMRLYRARQRLARRGDPERER